MIITDMMESIKRAKMRKDYWTEEEYEGNIDGDA